MFKKDTPEPKSIVPVESSQSENEPPTEGVLLGSLDLSTTSRVLDRNIS